MPQAPRNPIQGRPALSDYLHHYDQNTNNIKDLYNTLGITRGEMAAAKKQNLNSIDQSAGAPRVTSARLKVSVRIRFEPVRRTPAPFMLVRSTYGTRATTLEQVLGTTCTLATPAKAAGSLL